MGEYYKETPLCEQIHCTWVFIRCMCMYPNFLQLTIKPSSRPLQPFQFFLTFFFAIFFFPYLIGFQRSPSLPLFLSCIHNLRLNSSCCSSSSPFPLFFLLSFEGFWVQIPADSTSRGFLSYTHVEALRLFRYVEFYV